MNGRATDGPQSTRREVLRFSGAVGTLALTGGSIPTVVDAGTASVSASYFDHLQALMDSHGTITDVMLASSSSGTSTNAELCSVKTNDFSTDCGGGGGGGGGDDGDDGDDGGGGGGGGGGGTIDPNDAPNAAFNYSPTSPDTGGTVQFDASPSSDDDGWITSYQWDFGDGTNASGKQVSHSYADNGNYDVTLEVTDNDNVGNQETRTVSVSNRAPNVSISLNTPTPVRGGISIEFDGSGSSDPDGSIASSDFQWDFGDGTTASGPTVTHTYDMASTYTVSLTVTDDDGSTDTGSRNILVGNGRDIEVQFADGFTDLHRMITTGDSGSIGRFGAYMKTDDGLFQYSSDSEGFMLY